MKNAWPDNTVIGDPVECYSCKKSSCKKKCNCYDRYNCGGRLKCGCGKKDCYYPLPEEVKEDIDRIKNYIYNQGEQYVQYLDYDYKEVCFGEKISDLYMYLDVFQGLYNSLYFESKGYEKCLYYCPEDYIKARSEVNKIIGIVKIQYTDHFKDESGIDKFMAANPNMVSFDRWKKYLYNFQTQYEIKVTKLESKDNCLEVSYEALKANLADCKVLYSALKKVEKCNVSTEVEIDESKCSISYKALIKDHDCKITYDVYKSVMKCGFDAAAIKSVYQCGGKFEVKGSKNKCYVSFGSSPSVECSSNNIKSIIKTLECADIR